MKLRVNIILFFVFLMTLNTGCGGENLNSYKKSGENIKLSFKFKADSVLLVYRNYIDMKFSDTAVFLKGEKGKFNYTIVPKTGTNLIEYYFEDMNGNRYPFKGHFYTVFFRKKGKELRYANFNHARDLYKAGVRKSSVIFYYTNRELKQYPNDYQIYRFLDDIRYNIPNFNITLNDMLNMAKKGTPGFYRIFTVIMSRYNMKRADSLFNSMLSNKIKPINMIEYFGRASRDTAYISSIANKFPDFSYDIYKNCFLATVKYKIFKNYDYYYKILMSYKNAQNDPDIYGAIILSKRGDPIKAYEKLKELRKLEPEEISIIAEKMVISGDKKLPKLLEGLDLKGLSPLMLNGISYEMAIHGVDIPLAEKIIVAALDRFTLPYSFAKDFFTQFYKQKYHYYASSAYMMDTYAYILLQQKKINEAKAEFEKAITYLKLVGEEDPTILEHYSYILEKQKIPDDSLVVIYGKILSYGGNEEVKQKLRKIYVRKYGNDKAFDVYVKRLKRRYGVMKRIDRSIKNYSLKDVNNKLYHLQQFKGKVIILTVFKSECGFCKAEAYDLRRLQNKFKGSKSVVFIDITPDNKRKAIAFSREYKLKAITIPDAIDMINELAVVGTPTNFVIGTDGRIHYIVKGYFTDFKDIIEEMIKNELNVD